MQFEKISAALNLADKRQALFELAKGKLTTDPRKHSGKGVFLRRVCLITTR